MNIHIYICIYIFIYICLVTDNPRNSWAVLTLSRMNFGNFPQGNVFHSDFFCIHSPGPAPRKLWIPEIDQKSSQTINLHSNEWNYDTITLWTCFPKSHPSFHTQLCKAHFWKPPSTPSAGRRESGKLESMFSENKNQNNFPSF